MTGGSRKADGVVRAMIYGLCVCMVLGAWGRVGSLHRLLRSRLGGRDDRDFDECGRGFLYVGDIFRLHFAPVGQVSLKMTSGFVYKVSVACACVGNIRRMLRS